jgi:hypothetical protein
MNPKDNSAASSSGLRNSLRKNSATHSGLAFTVYGELYGGHPILAILSIYSICIINNLTDNKGGVAVRLPLASAIIISNLH